MPAEQGSLSKDGAPKLDIMQKSLEFISFGWKFSISQPN